MTDGWLGTSLDARAAGGGEAPAEVAALLSAILTEHGSLPPPGLALDLAALAVGGVDTPTRTPTSDDPALADALRRWTDRVIARLLSEPALDAVADAIASLPADHRVDAIGWWVGVVLQRFGAEGASLQPARVRKLAAGLPEPSDDPGTLAALAADVDAWAAKGARVDRFVQPADAFVITWLERLGTAARRVAFAQLMDTAAAFDRALPRRLRRSGPARGALPTRLEAESSYPIGGFSSISNSGSLENLVTSELIYLEPADPAGGVDLFELRWAEGELLYYARDEGTFVREPRELVWLLAPELAAARFRDPGNPVQRHVLALGAVVCAALRLADALSESALTLRLVLLPDASGKTPLAAEQDLLGLALRDPISRGIVRVEEGELAALQATLPKAARAAHVDVIWVSPEPAPAFGRPVRVHALPVVPQGWEAWRDALLALVRALL